MNKTASPFAAPTEAQILSLLERLESGRSLFLQLLRENPELLKFQDARTLENFGFIQPANSWSEMHRSVVEAIRFAQSLLTAR